MLSMFLTVAPLLAPLLTAGWLWGWPQRNALGFALHVLATGLLVSGVALAAIWLAVPRWTLFLPLLVLIGAVWRGLPAARARCLPLGPRAWAAAALAAVLALLGGWLSLEAMLGRRQPPGPVIALAMPLTGADICVVSGGSRLLINPHQDTLDLTIPRHRLWQGQSYGIDLIALNQYGRSSSGFRPADPSRYVIYGRSVIAPCAGTVIEARDGRPDQRVPKVDREVMQGNFVILRCIGADIALAHLQQGSVAVEVGDQLASGALIGRVGNSGLSDEPHLHLNAQTPGTAAAPFSGKPVIMLFDGRFLVRGDQP